MDRWVFVCARARARVCKGIWQAAWHTLAAVLFGVLPGVYGVGPFWSAGYVQMPAGVNLAPGAASQLIPDGQFERPFGIFAIGSQVRAHRGCGPVVRPAY